VCVAKSYPQSHRIAVSGFRSPQFLHSMHLCAVTARSITPNQPGLVARC
jgi:hypothetical protein